MNEHQNNTSGKPVVKNADGSSYGVADLRRDMIARGDDEFVAELEAAREQLDVAQAIYNARKEAGLSQKELALRIGTSQSVISRLEDADYDGHSMSMLRKVAEATSSRLEFRLVRVEPEQLQGA